MKGKGMLVLGLAAGVLLSMSAQAFAEPIITNIQAKINPEYHITFDGEKKELPEGCSILIYKDRTYVPARYVAEELGAEVNWHEDTKEIEILRPEAPVTPDTPSTSGGAVDTDPYQYYALPQNQTAEHFRLAVTTYVKETDRSTGNSLGVSLENKSNDPIMLDQNSARYTVDGKVYQIDPSDYHKQDTTWYRNIKKDEELSGTLLLPKEIKDAERVHVEVTVKSNGGYPAWEQTMEFNVQLK